MKRLVLFLCGILLACSTDFGGGNAYAQQLPRFGKRVSPKVVASAPCVINDQTMATRTASGIVGENPAEATFIASMSRAAYMLFDVLNTESLPRIGRRVRPSCCVR